MHIVMLGNRLHLFSGHSRSAWQIAKQLVAAGHTAQMVSSTLDPDAERRHAALLADEDYASLWQQRLEYPLSALKAGNRALRGRLEPVIEAADVVHFYDMRALRAVCGMFGGHVPAKAVLQLSSVPNLTCRHLCDAGWGAVIRMLTQLPHMISAITPKRYVRHLLGMADHVICTSQHLADVCTSLYGLADDQRTVVFLGQEPIEPADEAATGHYDFIYYGWPGAHRGTLDAAEALVQFKGEHPEARCMMSTYSASRWIGEDRLVIRALQGRIARGGVEIAGFMPDIRQRLGGVRAALFPFRSPFGYSQPPLVVLEALAAGVPVIATDVGSVAEMVRDGENGFIVPPADVPAMVEKMNVLWHDPSLAARMAQAARASVVERFDLETMFAGVLRVYAEVLDGKTN